MKINNMQYTRREINIKTCSYKELIDLYRTAKDNLSFCAKTPEYKGWLSITKEIYNEIQKRNREIGNEIIN